MARRVLFLVLASSIGCGPGQVHPRDDDAGSLVIVEDASAPIGDDAGAPIVGAGGKGPHAPPTPIVIPIGADRRL